MGQERWQGAQLLGPVGLGTGAKTSPQWLKGVAFRSSRSADSSWWRQECEPRSCCPPLAGSGQTESQGSRSLVPRTGAAAGKFPAAGSRTAFHFNHFPTNLSLAPVRCCAGNWRGSTGIPSSAHGTVSDSQTTYGRLRCPNKAAGVAQWLGGSPESFGSAEWDPQCYTCWT